MSHNISNIDRQQGIEQAWHGLTEILPFINLPESWLSQWDVSKAPMFEQDGSKSDYCRITCTDDPQIRIGSPVHCETYGLITNADFLKTVETAIREVTGAQVISVGSVCERARIFVSVKLAEMDGFNAAGREFLPYLNFMSSHDKSAPFAVNTSTICTVCDNTFRANLMASNGGAVRVRMNHSKNVGQRLANVPAIVDGFLGAMARFKREMDRLAAEPVKVQDANALFAGFLQDNPNAELSTRRANQISRLGELFVSGAGNRGENMADAFSAVTDYYSHESSGGDENRMKQYVSSEYGAGQSAKADFWDLLTGKDSRDRVAATIARGNKVLALV